jgi:hypothetical protein
MSKRVSTIAELIAQNKWPSVAHNYEGFPVWPWRAGNNSPKDPCAWIPAPTRLGSPKLIHDRNTLIYWDDKNPLEPIL